MTAESGPEDEDGWSIRRRRYGEFGHCNGIRTEIRNIDARLRHLEQEKIRIDSEISLLAMMRAVKAAQVSGRGTGIDK